MKKTLISTGLLLILLGIAFCYKEDILSFVNKNVIRTNKKITLDSSNSYYLNRNFNYVQIANNFEPKNKQDIKNIYYTVIAAGKNNFTFYCPDSYKTCLSDVKYVANDQEGLSHINNFVHPYNGFSHIETEYDSLGKITISITKSYTRDEIKAVNSKVSKIEKELITNDLTDKEKIEKIHDYIIDHSVYDTKRSDEGINNYKSDIAYGTLIEGYSLCGGYADSMAIFLNNMNIENYKISSDNHVWNAVKLDGIWYHLDLTWDDPVTSDGSNVIEHNFFLISTDELLKKEISQHNFNQDIYSELKI